MSLHLNSHLWILVNLHCFINNITVPNKITPIITTRMDNKQLQVPCYVLPSSLPPLTRFPTHPSSVLLQLHAGVALL